MFTAQARYGQDPHRVTKCGAGVWGQPFRWNKAAAESRTPRKVFTCSWSDFYIEESDEWRDEALSVVDKTPWLEYQILTKRPERVPVNESRANVWIGVSVENRKQGLPRIDILREITAAVRFLSIEPLLEDLGKINLDGIDWVIVGGESGPGYRSMSIGWAHRIYLQCLDAGVPFWFKQDSGNRPGVNPSLLGRVLQEFPSGGSN